jgi:hypothetical protein
MTSLETVKRYLRINGSGEDTLLTSLSLAAKQYLLNAGVKPPIPPTEATYFSGGATVEEAAYKQELELYDLAVTLYVNMLYNGADDKSLEAAMTSIILQIKDWRR